MADKIDQYLQNIGIDIDEHETQDIVLPKQVSSEVSGLVQGLSPSYVLGDDLKGNCENFLVGLLLNIDPAYAVDVVRVNEENQEVFVEIDGGEAGRLIGRGGRTLTALEHITNTVINRYQESRVRVNIDVSGYKKRRDERLVTLARAVAQKVRRTGLAVELEPMSPAERRIVHMEIAEQAGVFSESTGQGKDRRLAVKPDSEIFES